MAQAAPGVLNADVSQATDGSYLLQWRTVAPAMRVDVFATSPESKEYKLVGDDVVAGYMRVSVPEELGAAPRFYVVVDGGPKDPTIQRTVSCRWHRHPISATWAAISRPMDAKSAGVAFAALARRCF